MELASLGEFGFINRIKKAQLPHPETVAVGIGDDCAVYRTSQGMDQLVTTDMMVEGIHFDSSLLEPYWIGYRLAAANISDIAAMGGEPSQAVVSLAATMEHEVEWYTAVYEGLHACMQAYGVNLIGGDTVHTKGQVALSVTLLGQVPRGQAVLRQGAKPGDIVFVTGTLGNAQVGLESLQAGIDGYDFAKQVHKGPKPQVRLGQLLRQEGASSLNDVSDGLSSELNEIAKASQVSLFLKPKDILFHSDVKAWAKSGEGTYKSPLDYALYGGEDFQLVGTMSTASWQVWKKAHPQEPVRAIGYVKAGAPGLFIRLKEGQTRSLEAKGYNHFTRNEDK